MKPLNLLCTIAALGLPCQAAAQFPGDIFFEEPSVSAQEGSVLNLNVQGFVGADAFGGTTFHVIYDPQQLEMVNLSDPLKETDRRFFWEGPQGHGRRRVAVVHQDRAFERIGTVDLASLQVRVLAPAGSIVYIQISTLGMSDLDEIDFPNSEGFGAEIAVTSTDVLAESNQNSSSNLLTRAHRLRRPGHLLLMATPIQLFRGWGSMLSELMPTEWAPELNEE